MSTGSTPPAGFAVALRTSPFLEHALGELFEGRAADGRFAVGLFTSGRHANSRHVVHGGVLTTLADIAMGRAILSQRGVAPVTVAVETVFMRPVTSGLWLDARVDVLHAGVRLAFAHARFFAEDACVAHATGTFALEPITPPAQAA